MRSAILLRPRLLFHVGAWTTSPLAVAAATAISWLLIGCPSAALAEEAPPAVACQQDVVYGRKAGMALTLDVFRPGVPQNGAGVLLMVSGGWGSSHDAIDAAYVQHFTNRGYVVFAVVHSSSPKFSLSEIIDDVKRAARFVRANSREYGIRLGSLGATGVSSGAHLSLMLATQSPAGNPAATDAVDRQSSRVDCVACFFPPTDFNNFVRPDVNALDESVLKNYRKVLGEIPTDVAARDALGRSVSPIYGIASTTAPTLIFHGDKDPYVLLHQSQSFIDAARQAGVDAKLVVKRGESHGWKNMAADMEACADWFDAHLIAK